VPFFLYGSDEIEGVLVEPNFVFEKSDSVLHINLFGPLDLCPFIESVVDAF